MLVVGSGLTAIDTAITLLEERPDRRVAMASRHGLLPHSHVEQQSTAWVSPVPTGALTADRLAEHFADQVRSARANGVGWRAVVDGLRSPTQSLWLRLDLTERRRFLRTYARHWEVRRHRMAPEVAERIAEYQRSGRLTLLSGSLTGVADRGAPLRGAGRRRHHAHRRRGRQLHRPAHRHHPQLRSSAAGPT